MIGDQPEPPAPPTPLPEPPQALARVAGERGYVRWESGGLWVRSRERLFQVVGPDVRRIGGGDSLLDFGIWVPAMVSLVDWGTSELRDADDCHLVPLALRVDSGHPSADVIAAGLDRLDGMATLADVRDYLESDWPRRWPPGGGMRELYLAALDLLLGSPDVYWRSEEAARQLTGTRWYDAACHLYAMVATRE